MEAAIKESHKNLGKMGGTELPEFRSVKQWMLKVKRGLNADYPHQLCKDPKWGKLQDRGLMKIVTASYNKGMQLEMLLIFRKRITYYALKQAMPNLADITFEVQKKGCPPFWIKSRANKGIPLYNKYFEKTKVYLQAEGLEDQTTDVELSKAEIDNWFGVDCEDIDSPDVF